MKNLSIKLGIITGFILFIIFQTYANNNNYILPSNVILSNGIKKDTLKEEKISKNKFYERKLFKIDQIIKKRKKINLNIKKQNRFNKKEEINKKIVNKNQPNLKRDKSNLSTMTNIQIKLDFPQIRKIKLNKDYKIKQKKNTNTCVIDNIGIILKYQFNLDLKKDTLYQKIGKKIGDYW